MNKKILPLLLLFFASHFAHAVPSGSVDAPAVDTEEIHPDTYQPLVQNYFSFILKFLGTDYFLSNESSNPSGGLYKIKKIHFPSILRSNVDFLYAIRFKQSRFAFCAGLGWSKLSYAFDGQDRGGQKIYPTLQKDSESHTECREVECKQGQEVLKSAFEIPFVNFLFRLRFNSVLDDPKAGFHTWLGLKIGFRGRPATIVHYKEYNDSSASSIYNGYFNLRPYAVGVQFGIGYARFGCTGGLHLTPLFVENQGPSNFAFMKPFSIGIYVDLL